MNNIKWYIKQMTMYVLTKVYNDNKRRKHLKTKECVCVYEVCVRRGPREN